MTYKVIGPLWLWGNPEFEALDTQELSSMLKSNSWSKLFGLDKIDKNALRSYILSRQIQDMIPVVAAVAVAAIIIDASKHLGRVIDNDNN